MSDFKNKCFVCESKLVDAEYSINKDLNLPICNKCKGSEDEKKAIDTLLNGMADGFVCGCI